MTREPTFVLATAGSAVVAEGVHTAYKSIAEARTSLTSHSTPIIVGALPFDMSRPAALIRPQDVAFLDALPKWPLRPLPGVRITETLPEPDEHRARIATALQRLRDPASGLHKVVLARALRLAADGPLDARTIIDRLAAADPAATAYLADLTSAGTDYSGSVLVGASPELLVARHGEQRGLRTVRRFCAAIGRPRHGPGQAARRSPRRPRTATSTNWSSTRCARHSIRCVSICRSRRPPH